jgi:hypothetical protein
LVFFKSVVAKRGLGVVEFGFREIDGGKERLWGCGIRFFGKSAVLKRGFGVVESGFREID